MRCCIGGRAQHVTSTRATSTRDLGEAGRGDVWGPAEFLREGHAVAPGAGGEVAAVRRICALRAEPTRSDSEWEMEGPSVR